MKTAIVIVTYNAEPWLGKSLASCREWSPQTPVYVVDNNSRDRTVALIKRDYPWVKLIQHPSNSGFAAGNNIGIRRAILDGADSILLLNQDAQLTAGAIDSLNYYLQVNPHWAAVQPVILLPDGRVNSIGNRFHYLGFAEAGGNGELFATAWRQNYGRGTKVEPAYFSGAAVLLRASALRQVGDFSEELFMYHEDLELSLRCRLNGWGIGIAPEARVIHYYTPRRSCKQMYFMERNRYLVWLSYFKIPTLALLLIPALAAELAVLITAVFNRWLGAKIKVYSYFTRAATWDYIKQQRRQLKTLRKVSDRVILGWAASRLEWSGGQIFNQASQWLWRVIYPLIRW